MQRGRGSTPSSRLLCDVVFRSILSLGSAKPPHGWLNFSPVPTVSFFWYHRWAVEHGSTAKSKALASGFPLNHSALLQHLYYSWCCTKQPVHLTLLWLFLVNKTMIYLTPSFGPAFDPQLGGQHSHFPKENHGPRLGCADSHPDIWLKTAPAESCWRSQMNECDLVICKNI